jgi:hypothetical protein
VPLFGSWLLLRRVLQPRAAPARAAKTLAMPDGLGDARASTAGQDLEAQRREAGP